MKTILKSLVTVSSLIMGTQLALAEGLMTKVSCYDRGGGYLTSSLRVSLIDQEFVLVELERFSPSNNVDMLKIEGQSTAKIGVIYPREHCLIRSSEHKNVTLFACGLGIGTPKPMGPVYATLTSVDGSSRKVQLSNGVTFEVEQVVTNSAFAARNADVVHARFSLVQTDDNAELGFNISKFCK